MRIFHLSDIHYSASDAEKIRRVVDRLCNDVEGRVADDDFLVISGDLVWAGSKKQDFADFRDDFIRAMVERAGFSKDRIILCPGNHDIDSSIVGGGSRSLLYSHKFSPDEFDQLFLDEGQYFEDAFRSFTETAIGANRVGANYFYDFEDISFICLNTALLSVGGNSHLGSDDRRMAFLVSGLSDWLQQRKGNKICLILHHPISWLAQEWQSIIEALIKAHVDFVFHGHEHKNDLFFRYDDLGGGSCFLGTCTIQR